MRTHYLTKFLLIILQMLGLILAIYCFIVFNKPNRKDQLNYNIIGETLVSTNIVQLKHYGELSWFFLESLDKVKLQENDSLFTHKNSSATVKLNPSQEISIQAESFIRIKGTHSIDIKEGKINIKLGKNSQPFNIRLGEQAVEISSVGLSEFSINKTFTQGQIEVKTGNIQVRTKNHQLNLLAGDSTLITKKSIQSMQSSYELLSPKYKVYQDKFEPLSFKYNSQKEPKAIYIKRHDRTFIIPPSKQINLRGDFYEWGLLFKEESTPRKLVDFSLIKNVPAPIAISPHNKSHIYLPKNKANLEFKWTSNSKTLIEVSDLDNNIIFSKILDKPYYKINKFPMGDYKWRMKTLDKYVESSFSPYYYFSLSYMTIENSEKIEISRPGQLVKLDVNSSKALTYLISNDPSFKKIIRRSKIKNNKISFFAKSPGTYYWRVLGKNNQVSLKKIIIVPTPPPTKAPKVKDQIKKPQSTWFQNVFNLFFQSAYASDFNIRINWENIEDAESYDLEIKKSLNEDSKVFKINTKKPYYDWSPPDNEIYYYRVRYIDHWGRPSPFSKYAKVQLIDSLETTDTNKVESKKIDKRNTKSIKTNRFSLSHLSSSTMYQQGNSDIKVNGGSISGHSFSYIYFDPKDEFDKFQLLYKSQYGVVFNDQDFYQRNLDLNYSFQLLDFILGPNLSYSQLSYYSGEDQIEYSKDINIISIGLRLGMAMNVGKKHYLNTFYEQKLIGLDGFNIFVNYRYYSGNEFFFPFSLIIENYDLKEDKHAYSSSNFQLLMGFGVLF